MEEQRKQIGNRIKQRRKALHRTQDDVAEYLGCSNNTVSSIETGKQTRLIRDFAEMIYTKEHTDF